MLAALERKLDGAVVVQDSDIEVLQAEAVAPVLAVATGSPILPVEALLANRTVASVRSGIALFAFGALLSRGAL